MGVLLSVRDLRTHFFARDNVIKAVDGISFDLNEGGFMGLVGESGCGKSVTALSIMRLIPTPPGRVIGGSALFQGEDLLQLSDTEIRAIRGNRIAMVFQEPMTSLNPVLSIGRQLTESLEVHRNMSRQAARSRAVELMDMVGIPNGKDRLNDYPHQFSGGMRQRVMIAMALSCEPQLLIADEPTTALDVTIQAQILELINRLRAELGLAVIIITHNLGVVARYVEQVHVMYAGKIVEQGTSREVFKQSRHPYTLGLLESVPRLDSSTDSLLPIEGAPPDLGSLPAGCAFQPRCRFAVDRCTTDEPPLTEVLDAHATACWENERLAQPLAR